MSGVVVWLTGLPASGKSTLARQAARRLRVSGTPVAVLDGDEIRQVLGESNYGTEARAHFYAALSALAALLARQGLCVLVPATAHRRSYRQKARRLAPSFFEVYVEATPEQCARRDRKGLYAKARKGKAPALPGVGEPFETPTHADLVAHGGRDPKAVELLVAALTKRKPR